MPGLGQRTLLTGPSGMDAPDLRGIGPHAPMLGAAEGIDPAAEVDRQSPPVVRRPGCRGHAALAAFEDYLRGVVAIGVGDRDGGAEPCLEGMRAPVEYGMRVTMDHPAGGDREPVHS